MAKTSGKSRRGERNDDPILFYIHRLSRSIMRASMAQYLRLYGLGVPQMQILAQLGDSATMSSKDIAEYTAMHKALISRSLSELTALGYTRISQDAADARRSLWKLTRKGEELVAAFRPMRLERKARLLKVLTAREQAQLLSFIDRLYASSEELGREEARAAQGRGTASRAGRRAKTRAGEHSRGAGRKQSAESRPAQPRRRAAPNGRNAEAIT